MRNNIGNLLIDRKQLTAWRDQLVQAAKTPWLASQLLRRLAHLREHLARLYRQWLTLLTLHKRWRRRLRQVGVTLLAGGALVLALHLQPVQAQTPITLDVDTTVDENDGAGGTGLSLRDAILMANADPANDYIIRLQSGQTYSLNVHTTPEEDAAAQGDLDIVNNGQTVSIEVSGGGMATIDGNVTDRVFHVQSGAILALSNVTIQNGGGSLYSNSGILNQHGILTLRDCVVSGNVNQGIINRLVGQGTVVLTVTTSTITGNEGTGIVNVGHYGPAQATLIDSTISGNSSGIFNSSQGYTAPATLTVSNSNISDNSNSGISGSGSNYGFADITVMDSTISGNVSGIRSSGSNHGFVDITVMGSTISDNSDSAGYYYYDGGGVANDVDEFGEINLTLTNSTISGNSVNDSGGGIYNRARASGSISVTLTDSTISDNVASQSGGGIFSVSEQEDGIDTRLTNSVISGNSAGYNGGGIYNIASLLRASSSVRLTNSTVSGNSAGNDGGGIYNRGNDYGERDPITLIESTITGNAAIGSGGGIFNTGNYEGDEITLTESALTGNAAGEDGGGIFNYADNHFYGSHNSSVRLTASTVSGNTAGDDGAGIFSKAVDTGATVKLTVIDSTIANNISNSSGGGLFNSANLGGTATLSVTNSTLSGNEAQADGGGIFNVDKNEGVAHLILANASLTANTADSNSGGGGDGGGLINKALGPTARAQNTIIAGNLDLSGGTIHPDVSGALIGDAHNLIGDLTGSGGTIGTGSDIVDPNPLLGPLADNGGSTETHALFPGSPALDAGDNSLCPATDQRGVLRPQGGVCDIGAFEFQEMLPEVRLTIASEGADIELSWPPDPALESYTVHRSSSPFFTPGAGTVLTTLPAGSVAYTDPGVAGQVGTNYFYIVQAARQGGTVDSNEVGEIDYPSNNAGGQYSLITIPLSNTIDIDAASVANHLGNVGAMLKWNPETQTFRFFVPPSTGDNFELKSGEPVFVQVNAGGPSVVTMVGEVVAVQHDLTAAGFNFISLPLQRADLTDASEVAGDITTVNAMLGWNEATQTFRFFVPPSTGDDFPVEVGLPFVIDLAPGGPPGWP